MYLFTYLYIYLFIHLFIYVFISTVSTVYIYPHEGQRKWGAAFPPWAHGRPPLAETPLAPQSPSWLWKATSENSSDIFRAFP